MAARNPKGIQPASWIGLISMAVHPGPPLRIGRESSERFRASSPRGSANVGQCVSPATPLASDRSGGPGETHCPTLENAQRHGAHSPSGDPFDGERKLPLPMNRPSLTRCRRFSFSPPEGRGPGSTAIELSAGAANVAVASPSPPMEERAGEEEAAQKRTPHGAAQRDW